MIGTITLPGQSVGAGRIGKILRDQLAVRVPVLTGGGGGTVTTILLGQLVDVGQTGKILRDQLVVRGRALIDAAGGGILLGRLVVLALVRVGVTGEDNSQDWAWKS